MSGNRVKVNIADINDDLDDDFEFIEILEVVEDSPDVKVKVDIEDAQDSISSDVPQNQKKIKYAEHRSARPIFDRFSEVFDENKEDLKENLRDIKSRASEKRDSFDRQFDKIDKISDFSKNIIDEVFLSSESFINWIKYEKSKDEGREIEVEKKE